MQIWLDLLFVNFLATFTSILLIKSKKSALVDEQVFNVPRRALSSIVNKF